MEDRLSELERRLGRLEEAVNLLTAIVEPLAEAHAEGKAAKKNRRWFRREPVMRGKWLDLFAVGFKRPET